MMFDYACDETPEFMQYDFCTQNGKETYTSKKKTVSLDYLAKP